MATMFCNGAPASAVQLAAAQTNYGHFTSMQVRSGAVQGLGLHLQRLQHATGELFGTVLDLDQLQQWLRAALDASQLADASLRVTVFSTGFDFRRPAQAVPPDVLVAVSAPVLTPVVPISVRTVRYRREFAEIKHVGTFALFQHRRLAVQAGFDDALFVGDDDAVLEGTTWNIALAAGDDVVWPQGDSLPGICRALLEQGIAQCGGMSRRAPVVRANLAGFDAAVACNATSVRAIAAIDGQAFSRSGRLAEQLQGYLAGVPWERL